MPTATRPKMQNYGITTDIDGLLPWSWADERLTKARNYWISTAGSDGKPHAAPVWGVWQDGALYFGSEENARKARNLRARPDVIMHLESGDEVVIVEGRAEFLTLALLPAEISPAYDAKYSVKLDDPAALMIRITPQVVLAWQETDFPKTATRFVF
ncbi:MAG: pyridoxamine 5'-phosphate oxidase family protein [Chloroflexota bacterium]|nr:pyridoxamine 5'-phosphate oxidase family protein [Chloroflexota bacterium]